MKRNLMAVTIVMLVITKYKQTHENYEKIKKRNTHLENKKKDWRKVARGKIGDKTHLKKGS